MRHLVAALGVAILLSGCQTTATNDAAEPVVAKGDCIETRSVTAYYGQGVPYWTDQQLLFCPAAVRLDIAGTEPEAVYQARYTKGQFSVVGLNAARIRELPAGLMNAPLAELVYYSFTAGAGIEPSNLGSPQNEKLMGQRYEVFVVGKTGKRKVSLYKNLASGQFELVRVVGEGADWMAAAYNPRYHERLKRMVPRKIDVFDVAAGVAAKQLVVQYEFVNIQ